MAVLRVNHPKIVEFIECKRQADFSCWAFNNSVLLTDEFMDKAKNNESYDLVTSDGRKVDEMPAREVLQKIAEAAHYCGEPGILFPERFEEENPTPDYKYEGYSPCGEIAMAKGETCQFSYINLANFVLEEGKKFDFHRLAQVVRDLTRALDDTIECSIKHSMSPSTVVSDKRRIGIGVCGLADMFFKLRLGYDSEEAVLLAENILSAIDFHSKLESIQLASERGAFPFFQKSRFAAKDWVLRK